jgi:hypothetical protein
MLSLISVYISKRPAALGGSTIAAGRFLLLCLLLCCSVPSRAQTPTSVTGTITDPNGLPYSGASVTAQLVPGGVSPTVNGAQINGFNGPVLANDNGRFSMDLFCNTAGGGCSVISPSGTQWQFTVCEPGVPPPLGFGNTCFSLAVTITGATQNVSATLSAAAPALARTLAASTISFSGLTSGTNTTAAMVVGTGASLATSGSGTIAATSVPFSGVAAGTNTNALVIGTGGSLGTSGSGTITATNGLTGGATGFLPKYASATTATPSLCDEGITAANALTCGDTAGAAFVSVSTGTAPPTCTPGSGGADCATEGSAPTPAASVDTIHGDSAAHAWIVNNNNTGEMVLSRAACVNLTPVTVNTSTTSDQNLQACSFNANALNATSHTLKVWLSGVYSTPAASTAAITIKLKLCTVSGCGSGTVITPINIVTPALGVIQATNDPYNLTAYLSTQTSGASSAYEAQGTLNIDLAASVTTAASVFPGTNTATVGTINATGALFLQATIAFSAASASNASTSRQLIAELID